MTKPHVVIIGSGFAGSVAAARLAGSECQLTLLERGPWRETRPAKQMGVNRRALFPKGWSVLSRFLYRLNAKFLPGGVLTLNSRGVYEVFAGKGLDVICSSQVGGGSHVYGALHMRPAQHDYWDGRHPKLDAAMLDTHYDYIFKKMDSQAPDPKRRYPNMFGDRFGHHSQFKTDSSINSTLMGIRMGEEATDLSLSRCSMLGCDNGNKVTLDGALLEDALAQGLEVRDRCEVESVERVEQGASRRYRIRVKNLADNKCSEIYADKVILAAGAMNTIKLLFKSESIGGLGPMPSLGKHFSGNGDFAAYWQHSDDDADLSCGLPTRGRVQLDDHEEGASDWPLIVEGALPYSQDLPPIPGLRKMARQGTLLAAMGDDEMPGTVRYQNKRLVIEYPSDKVKTLADSRQAIDRVAAITQRPVKHFPKPLTFHPMGGARLGADIDRGVVDHTGQVFQHSGLYVADAAALPACLGVAPSMSIAAWAGHVACGLATSLNE